jgi:Flp pilus assembly pilin Flp
MSIVTHVVFHPFPSSIANNIIRTSKERHILRPFATNPRGQAAVEYILTLSGVFLALVGVASCFGSWLGDYLETLSPFLQDAFFQ